jgi:hypothetical protein
MTTIAGLRPRSVDLACRWSSTGCHYALSIAPCGHQSKPATATLNDRLNHQPEVPLPTSRVIARAQAQCAPSPTPVSAKSPSRVRGALPSPSPAGSFLGGFRTPVTVILAPSFMAGIRNPARHRPVSASHVKKSDLLRTRPVEHTDRLGGGLQ